MTHNIKTNSSPFRTSKQNKWCPHSFHANPNRPNNCQKKKTFTDLNFFVIYRLGPIAQLVERLLTPSEEGRWFKSRLGSYFIASRFVHWSTHLSFILFDVIQTLSRQVFGISDEINVWSTLFKIETEIFVDQCDRMLKVLLVGLVFKRFYFLLTNASVEGFFFIKNFPKPEDPNKILFFFLN
jgi:hypothetical protein